MKELVNSETFNALSTEAKNLYYTAAANADSEAVYAAKKAVLRAFDGAIEELVGKGYFVPYNGKYIVVTSEAMRDYLLYELHAKDMLEVFDTLDTESVQEETESADSDGISIKREFMKIYTNYPCSYSKNKKQALNLYYKWLTGKRVDVMGEKKTIRYNHLEIAAALQQFVDDYSDTEEKFIPRLTTFLGDRLCDYVTKSRKAYQEQMQEAYGDDWRRIKFKYVRDMV